MTDIHLSYHSDCAKPKTQKNVFVWVFGLTIWTLISCSISVDGLSFHHIILDASDSIKFKSGEFIQE